MSICWQMSQVRDIIKKCSQITKRNKNIYLYMYISVGHLIECEIIYIFHSRLANSFQRDRRLN